MIPWEESCNSMCIVNSSVLDYLNPTPEEPKNILVGVIMIFLMILLVVLLMNKK